MPTATKLFEGTRILGEIRGLSVTIEVHHCGTCGVIFGFEEKWAEARRSDKASWYCPNGHVFSWNGRPEVYELRDKLAAEKKRVTATRELLHAEERSHSATRGHLTRTKRRVANGVCPCCNRTFKQLAAHMERQHPGYVETAGS